MPKDINILIVIIAFESLLDIHPLGVTTTQHHVFSYNVSLTPGVSLFRTEE
jgi:hypothetical protein